MKAYLVEQKNRRMAAVIFSVAVSAALLAGCGHKQQNFQMPPQEVGVITVQSEPLPITSGIARAH